MRAWLSPLILVAGWGLLLAAWAFGNPPFAAPDEESHYVRALGLSEGEIASDEVPAEIITTTEQQADWQKEVTRVFTVPAGFVPPRAGCYVLIPESSALCLDQAVLPPDPARLDSAVGTYQPLPYVLPGLAARTADGPFAALRVARVVQALTVLAMLALAVAVLWRPGAPPGALLGVALAVTPFALFIGAALNGSGLEIAAAIAFCACVLRLTRADPSPRWIWGATGVAGVVLVLSRTTGVGWLVLFLVLAGALCGVRGSGGIVRRGARPALLALGATALAIVANRLWEATEGTPTPMSLRAFRLGVEHGVDSLADVARGFVGTFGYLEFKLPVLIPIVWLAVIAAVVAAALVSARLRDRLVLVGAILAAITVPVGLYVLVIRHTGFGLQPRYAMPILVAVPLLAGELATRHHGSAPQWLWRILVPAAALTAAVIHPLAWFYNARRSAVGVDGDFWFIPQSEWDPPLGWWIWLVTACAGGLAVAASILLTSRK